MKLCCFLVALIICQNSVAQKIIAEQKFEAENIKKLTINGAFCDIRIEKGTKFIFEGIIEGNGNPGDFEFKTDLKNDEIVIKLEQKTRKGWSQLKEAQMIITLPSGTAVNLKNSSGDIYMRGVSSNKHIIETSSGDIELFDIQSNMLVGSTSGEIFIDGLQGQLTSESTSGDQLLKNIVGNIVAESTSGNLEFISVEGDIEAKSTSGDIELSSTSGNLTLRSTSGEIEGSSITLKMFANLRANSGDIEMKFENNIADLSYDLTSSSGEIEMRGMQRRKSLKINEGGIMVTAVTTSGNQNFQ